MSEESYFDPTNLIIKKVGRDIAKQFVENNHYSHKLSLCKISYGLFYKTNIPAAFFDCNEDKLIGVCVFSQPCGRSAAESISDVVKFNECMELIRLVILNEYGKNIESFFISQSLKLLKKDFPHIKVVISYSDTEQHHSGTIYQASNFLFTGLNSDTNLMANYSISLTGPPHDDYKWLHSRTVSCRMGSHNVEYLKKKIGHTFWRKKEAGKFRYIYMLSDKKTKRKILKTLKMKILPYPKNCNYKEDIEKIEVNNSGSNNTPLENQFFD